jgi:hypothetical protein
MERILSHPNKSISDFHSNQDLSAVSHLKILPIQNSINLGYYYSNINLTHYLMVCQNQTCVAEQNQLVDCLNRKMSNYLTHKTRIFR